MRYLILLILVIFLPSSGFAGSSVVEAEFKTGKFNWKNWCPAQIDLENAPVEYSLDVDDKNDFIATITANENSLGGNLLRKGECIKPVATISSLTSDIIKNTNLEKRAVQEDSYESEFLGESFFADQSDFPTIPGTESFLKSFSTEKSVRKKRNPYCTKAKLKQATAKGEETEYSSKDEVCMQRQELRFQKRFRHPHDVPHSYSIKFRMPSEIKNRKDSLRWVIAQWKYQIDKKIYKSSSASPFLAMRFDDGVHHITIQDEQCRCIVASAPHPIASKNRIWKNGTPKFCRARKNRTCSPAFKVEYGANPVLTPPLGNWVTMDFQVQASRDAAEIIISENGRRIVRIYGKIGYHPDLSKTDNVKFKIGHYRSYQPFEHKMDIDWVKVSKTH